MVFAACGLALARRNDSRDGVTKNIAPRGR
jgi:hypothetical protein